jgi:hypothetical protein
MAHVTLEFLVLAGSRRTWLLYRSTPGPPSLRYPLASIGYWHTQDGAWCSMLSAETAPKICERTCTGSEETSPAGRDIMKLPITLPRVGKARAMLRTLCRVLVLLSTYGGVDKQCSSILGLAAFLDVASCGYLFHCEEGPLGSFVYFSFPINTPPPPHLRKA